jgi:hypothetical protein
MAVTDYRTSTTGITSAHLSSGRSTQKKKKAARRFVYQGGWLFVFPTPGLTRLNLFVESRRYEI